jgi:predicted restriction endonuclease
MKRRDWTEARAKVDDEAQCRVCGKHEGVRYVDANGMWSRVRLEAAHLWQRSQGGTENPNNIVPLCQDCHRLLDAHRLNIGHVLTDEENAELTRQAGSIGSAYRRAYPIDYREETAA